MDRKGPIIRQYLAENHFRTISDNTYEHIEEWLEWYQNEVAKFHHYNIYRSAGIQGRRSIRRGNGTV